MKLYLFISLVTLLCFSGCIKDCQISCPVKCSELGFTLLQDSLNILENHPDYNRESIYLRSASNPLYPPSLLIGEKGFRFIVCEGDYYLQLREGDSILVQAKIIKISSDHCCEYYGMDSIWFNNQLICSIQGECNLTYELP